ncbi:hypothetical protein AAGS40_29945 (plasmid) [Paraburkholderia sp. PREW-6R]|uniref:hypothetical protein n=1 Tax=Paraburkholderia sp. PREW-6R TaxID=3141544 RepID=UPI0031F55670
MTNAIGDEQEKATAAQNKTLMTGRPMLAWFTAVPFLARRLREPPELDLFSRSRPL